MYIFLDAFFFIVICFGNEKDTQFEFKACFSDCLIDNLFLCSVVFFFFFKEDF